MSFLSSNSGTCEKVELRPKQCIDAALKPLLENIDIRINGSLNSKDLFYTAMCMAVDKSSVHSASKHYQEIPCETSLRYHLRQLSLEELIQANENILLHSSVGTLKPGPITIDEHGGFRFVRFILFVEKWLRRKLRIQLGVQCLR